MSHRLFFAAMVTLLTALLPNSKAEARCQVSCDAPFVQSDSDPVIIFEAESGVYIRREEVDTPTVPATFEDGIGDVSNPGVWYYNEPLNPYGSGATQETPGGLPASCPPHSPFVGIERECPNNGIYMVWKNPDRKTSSPGSGIIKYGFEITHGGDDPTITPDLYGIAIRGYVPSKGTAFESESTDLFTHNGVWAVIRRGWEESEDTDDDGLAQDFEDIAALADSDWQEIRVDIVGDKELPNPALPDRVSNITSQFEWANAFPTDPEITPPSGYVQIADRPPGSISGRNVYQDMVYTSPIYVNDWGVESDEWDPEIDNAGTLDTENDCLDPIPTLPPGYITTILGGGVVPHLPGIAGSPYTLRSTTAGTCPPGFIHREDEGDRYTQGFLLTPDDSTTNGPGANEGRYTLYLSGKEGEFAIDRIAIFPIAFDDNSDGTIDSSDNYLASPVEGESYRDFQSPQPLCNTLN